MVTKERGERSNQRNCLLDDITISIVVAAVLGNSAIVGEAQPMGEFMAKAVGDEKLLVNCYSTLYFILDV